MRKKQIIVLGVVMGVALVGLIFTQAGYFRTAFKLKRAQFDFLVNKSMDQTISFLEERDRQRRGHSAQDVDLLNPGKNGVIHEIPLGLDIKLDQHTKEKVCIVRDYSVCPMEYNSQSKDENVVFGRTGTRNLQNSIEKSRQALKKSLGKDYDLIVVSTSTSERTLEERISGVNLEQVLAERLKNNGIHAKFEFAVKERGEFTLMSQNFFYRHSEYAYSRKMYFGESQSIADLFLIFPEQMHDVLSSIFLILPSLIITVLLVLCFVFCITELIKQKKLSAIKNDFINNMTHEFKTPIATISLASQMLKDGSVNNSPATIDRIAGIIRDESKRLTFQVEKVLQTALFTETRMKLKLKNVNLNEVVENLVAKFSLRVEDKGGQLYCYLEADRDEVYADEVHITNVLSNLLDNAIKYCAKVPEISVYTRNKEDEIIISVIDNGIGIATNEQKLIFERFYRVSTGNLHDVKGFGLGLSYVKNIIEAHGGRVKVESAEGKGSRFDVILPLQTQKKKIKRTLFF